MEARADNYGDMPARLCTLHRSIKETADKHRVNKALQPKGEDIVTHENIYLQPEREEETYKFLSMHTNIC